ncbi:hypothetical protein HK098_000921 [Nowakowskiella sp. JEL0407]|nr:hypothetical protein HK098_000921 [Nowakowskiella sp. JEL0407]
MTEQLILYLRNPSSTKTPSIILDIRHETSTFSQRLNTSICIPISELRNRMSELPDKHALIYLIYDESTSEVIEFLHSRGWINMVQINASEANFWEKVTMEVPGTVVSGEKSVAECARIGYLPLQFLLDWINRIELELLSDFIAKYTDDGNLIKGESLDGELSETEIPVEFRVCDVGCGSGRDLNWICSRDLRGESTTQNVNSRRFTCKWMGYGLDSWKGSLARTTNLSQRLGIPPKRLKVYQTEFCEKSKRVKSLGSVDVFSVEKMSGQFDLIVLVRIHLPSFFNVLRDLIKVGGFVLWYTFVEFGKETGRMWDGTIRPTGAEHIVQNLGAAAEIDGDTIDTDLIGEGFPIKTVLGEEFGESYGFNVLEEFVERLVDGRPVVRFIARKM